MNRVLCVWLPNWPLQRLAAARPELKGRALVLYQDRPRQGACVVACSRRAVAAGVVPGMSLAEACGAWSDPHLPLHQERYDPAADRAALQKLAEWCQRFSPTVGFEETGGHETGQSGSAPPDSLLLDATGLAKLFGGEQALAEHVSRAFRRRGYLVRVALADTIGAAWAVARSVALTLRVRTRHAEHDDYTKRDCTKHDDYTNAASVRVIPPGQSRRALAPLPIAALRLADETARPLSELGIERIGQLESLPPAGLVSRFGTHLAERLAQADGTLAEVIVAHRPPPAIEGDWTFPSPTDRRDVLEGALERLIGRIVAVLERRGQGVDCLECRLDCESGPPLRLSVGLVRATSSSRHLLDLLRLRLERLHSANAVSAIRVEVPRALPLELRQRRILFSDGTALEHSAAWREAVQPEEERELAVLIDRLASRLGRECVVRARLVFDAQPELAYRYESWIGGPARRRRSTAAAPPGWSERPLRLSPRPVPATVLSVVPDGPPIAFRLRGQEYRIHRALGPERIETGWWRRRAAQRDYYRVQSDRGVWLWLFRHLPDGRWYCQGWFE